MASHWARVGLPLATGVGDERGKKSVASRALPDIHTEFYTASAAVLQHVLDTAGFQLLVASTGNDPKAEQDALAAMLDRQVDGIVHVPVDDTTPLPDGVPVVQLNRRSDPPQAPAVISDDVTGIAELTSAIIRAGHTDHAVIVGPPDHSTSRDRLAGYHEAAVAAGIPETGRSRVLVCPFTPDGGASALAEIADDLPDALIALSSRLMLGVLRECGHRGIRIPTDMSLAGHGDPDWYAVWQPGITTYAPPLAEMGRIAAETLLNLLDEPGTANAPEPIRVAGTVITRSSVAGWAPS